MADGRGGYRRPGNPAAVSGPGRLSRRTDGGPINPRPEMTGGGEYGATKEIQEIISGAPVGQNPTGATAAPANFSGPGLTDPSMRPDEPVTSGAALGDGPGEEALGLPGEESDISSLAPYLPTLEYMANQRNAHPSTRAFVRRIKANL